jgi:hypothetical protein
MSESSPLLGVEQKSDFGAVSSELTLIGHLTGTKSETDQCIAQRLVRASY